MKSKKKHVGLVNSYLFKRLVSFYFNYMQKYGENQTFSKPIFEKDSAIYSYYDAPGKKQELRVNSIVASKFERERALYERKKMDIENICWKYKIRTHMSSEEFEKELHEINQEEVLDLEKILKEK